MKRIIIGTAGHIDHGKSALVKALTGIDPDRLREEKERGITIDLGFAYIDLEGGVRAGIVDVPGHEKFVKNMVAGAFGIDLLLLVIAADEGVMPQTREHLDICETLGIHRAVVALTKCDLVEEEWISMMEEEVRSHLKGRPFQDSPIVPVSSVTGEGLEKLKEVLARAARQVPGKDAGGLLFLPLDRAFSIKGAGTVVTGTLFSGSVRAGEDVVVLPGGHRARVRAIQSHGEDLEEARAGMRAALNLSGVDRDSLERGSVVVREGEVSLTSWADAFVRNLPVNVAPFRYGERLTLHCGTARVECRVYPYEKREIPPGEGGYARVRFDEPLPLIGGLRFILRGYRRLENFGYTVGGGVVLNPRPPARNPARSSPAPLEILMGGNERERVETAVRESAEKGITVVEIACLTGLGRKRVEEAVRGLVEEGVLVISPDGQVFPAGEVEAGKKLILERVQELNRREPSRDGFSPGEVVGGVRGFPRSLLEFALRELAREGKVQKGAAGYLPAVRKEEKTSLEMIARCVESRGVEGPTPAEISRETGIPERDVRNLLGRLVREGRAHRVRDFYFSAEVVESVAEKVRSHFREKEELTVSEFRQLIGTSRKYAVPLAELLDQLRVTVRKGDVRVLWKR